MHTVSRTPPGFQGDKRHYHQLSSGQKLPYVAWTSAGFKAGGDAPASYQPTPEAAWGAWDVAFSDYQQKHPGELIWREYPTLQQTSEGSYYVWARLTSNNTMEA